jgi:hypothetical protein
VAQGSSLSSNLSTAKKKKKKPTQNKKQKNLREVIATVSIIFLKYPRQDTNEEKGVIYFQFCMFKVQDQVAPSV